MSLKSTLLRIGSYATPFIPGVNVLSPMIIAGANAAAEGMDNADAAKKANAQLQTGNNQAIDTYKEQFAPYTNLGSQSANTLAGLMGFSPLPSSSDPMAGGGDIINPQAQPTTRQMPEGAVPVGQAQGRGTLASLGQQAQAQAQSRSSFSRMRSPDGDEEDVPNDLVEHYRKLGGQVI